MSNKTPKSRLPPSASSPIPSNSPLQHAPAPSSKLPRFFQKPSRDRSRSMTDPTSTGSNASLASSSSVGSNQSIPMETPTTTTREKAKKGSRFGSSRQEQFNKPVPVPQSQQQPQPHPQPQSQSQPQGHHQGTSIESSYSLAEDSMDEPPVIIEPVPQPTPNNPFPRPRTRSERPISDIGHSVPHLYTNSSSPSTSRISDFPTKLSGWFSHAFSSSSTDLSLPTLLSQSSQLSSYPSGNITSPTKTRSNALLMAARHGTRHLDKAMRYLLDSDAQPDRCTDPIWILGVRHPGYEPPPPPSVSVVPGQYHIAQGNKRRSSVSVDSEAIGRRGPSSYSYRGPGSPELSLSQSHPSSQSTINVRSSPSSPYPGHNWPPIFYADFTSRIWLTYRSQFAPIRDTSLSALESGDDVSVVSPSKTTIGSGKWNWVPRVGEKSWTSDSGWGCMLRTGQSLLANALLHMHLGRDWRRPPQPLRTADYAFYVQIITWFLDSPSPQAPFSVHRMALAGKELGTEVGCWFGPSVAAGAIKTLVHAFPEAGLGVSVASDGCVYQSDVFAASSLTIGSPHSGARRYKGKGRWGGRAVLVLVGIRLGLDGVNPIYYDAIKALYTFPQSVGIAGGRPSSSYYFVGSQADNLFYLDPHHARPTVPLRPPPKAESPHFTPQARWERQTTPELIDRRNPLQQNQRSPNSNSRHTQYQRAPTSPSSTRTGGSTASSAPLSPSPLQHQISTSSNSTSSLPRAPGSPAMSTSDLELGMDRELDAVQEHLVDAYSLAELKTFHCERVRKMPLSGLDPSMLIGFLCKDEGDWIDFRKRITELGQKHKTIFIIQDEPPTWPSDSDEFMGLESMSEPDDLDLDDQQEGTDEPFFDAQHDRCSSSTSPDTSVKGGAKSSEFDTEDDPVGPITPGPNPRSATFDGTRKDHIGEHVNGLQDDDDNENDDDEDEDDDDDDDDDEWVDPSAPTPIEQPHSIQAPGMSHSKSNGSANSDGSKSKSKSKKSGKANLGTTPIMQTPELPAHFPFPSSAEDDSQQPLGQSPDITENGMKPRMHTARARDGGRTQSGGVKGVLTADDHESF